MRNGEIIVLKKLRNIAVAVAAALLLAMPVSAGQAGIESVLQGYQQEAGNAFEDYEIPVENLNKDETDETVQQESPGDQNTINSTINVGAKTVDVSKIRELLIGLVISCGILIFCGIQKSDWYKKI